MTTTTPIRVLVGLAAATLAATTLTGCSLIQQFIGGGDATRDENGSVVEGNDNADVFLMKVGDCLNDAEASGTVSTVPLTPCSELHDSEVYFEHTIAGDDYPGDSAVSDEADSACYDAFEPFVGMSYEESALEMSYYRPSSDSWSEGDRIVSCVIYDPAGQVQGSLAGAAR